MKIIKGIGYFILIILAAALLAAAFAPAEKEIQRSITIDSPSNQVYGQIVEFRNWKNWDAWHNRDTTQERTYTGKPGEKEQSYTWESENENVGNGRMKMLASKENERLNYRFYFDNGGGAEDSAQGSFILTELEGSTKVEWTMISTMGYPWKIFNYFIESMVGPDFEEGLSNMKKYVENEMPDLKGIERELNVETFTEYGVNYVGIKVEELSMSDMTTFFEDGYKKIYSYLASNELEPKGPSRGLYYLWDEENSITTVAAAVPISDLLTQEYSKVTLGKDSAFLTSNHIQATSFGGYSDNYKTHTSLYQWLEANGKEMKYPLVEEYTVGPLQTADTSQFETKIIYYFD